MLATLAGYSFSRLKFMGRQLLFYLILALMMVLAMRLGLRDTYWGLWLFYVSGGQVFAIFLMRSFLKSLPEDLFETARIEGAGELRCIWHVAIPLSRPILVTVAIMLFLGLYNNLI